MRFSLLSGLAVSALVGALLVAPVVAAPAEAVGSLPTTWGAPQLAVPSGTNSDGDATVNSVSCPSVGNCAAGGFFNADGVSRAFVVSQVRGVWGAHQLAVPIATNSGRSASVNSVSCASAGNCSAGGTYQTAEGAQAFVVSQVGGVWGAPQLAVPIATNDRGNATVNSVSCASAGNCSAGGSYYTNADGLQPFVVSQVGGVWGAPQLAVPIATNSGGNARVATVSCPSAGNCSAGGSYRDAEGFQAFVVSQVGGVWGAPQLAVPILTNLGRGASVSSVSCVSAGNCSAGGNYDDGMLGVQAFVVSQVGGVWGAPQLAVPAATNFGGNATVNSVSCVSAGNCSAGGYYTDSSGQQAFVVSQLGGVWGAPQLAVSTATNSGNFASVSSVSCASAGNCVAGAHYRTAGGVSRDDAVVVPQVGGVWGSPVLVVPTATNAGGNALVNAVSCVPAGICAAGGAFSDSASKDQAFVVLETVVFSDVPSGRPFAHEIAWLAASGVTNGYSDGTFRPLGTVNRDAMAAFLYRFAGKPAFTPPAVSPFSDVSASTPFYKEITWLASTGITGGFSDGTFRPLGTVNRDAMAAFLYRFAGRPAFTPPAVSPFSDVSALTPFYKEITWLASTGITGGFSDGTFRPLGTVKRDAMAAFLFRFDDRGLGRVG